MGGSFGTINRPIVVDVKFTIDHEGTSCTLCVNYVEFSTHSFVTCNLVSSVWYFSLLWVQMAISKDLRFVFEFFFH